MIERLAIFAGYDSKNRIDDYVVYYLKELKKVADIIFVYDNDFPERELEKIQGLVIHHICRKHGEYDFGSYKRGFLWAKKTGLLEKYNSLILCNDSVFGPFYPLDPIFKKFEEIGEVDFWGMYCSYESIISLHMQSYFWVLNKNVYTHPVFYNTIRKIEKKENKFDIIRSYEVGLSQKLIKAGLKYDALFIADGNQPNGSHAIRLLKKGFPFLKKTLFDPQVPQYCRDLVKYKDHLKQISTAYDVSLIENYINNYYGKEKVEKHLNSKLMYLKPIRRFFYQKKIDKHGKKIVKICKIQILKYTPAEPVADPSILVSVVMPVYEKTIFAERAVESILHQSHTNFELIIAYKNSAHIDITRYNKHDSRVRFIRVPTVKNNNGKRMAAISDVLSKQSRYVMIASPDDISIKERMAIQIRFMEKNPFVDFVGSIKKTSFKRTQSIYTPEYHEAIKASFLIDSPINHETLMIRKSFLDESQLRLEKFFSQHTLFLAEAGLKHYAIFHNIQVTLAGQTCNNISTYGKNDKEKIAAINYQLQELGITGDFEISLFNRFLTKDSKSDKDARHKFKLLLSKIIELNQKKHLYPHSAFVSRLMLLYRDKTTETF